MSASCFENNNSNNAFRNFFLFIGLFSSCASIRSWSNGSLATTKAHHFFFLAGFITSSGPYSVWITKHKGSEEKKNKFMCDFSLCVREAPRLGHSLKWSRVTEFNAKSSRGLPFSLYTEVPTWKFSGMLNVEKSPVPGMKYGGLFALPSRQFIDSRLNTIDIWSSLRSAHISATDFDCSQQLCNQFFTLIATLKWKIR